MAGAPTMDRLSRSVASGSAVRDRSEIVTVVTLRGHVDVARHQMRGRRRASGWAWLWVARRRGHADWCDGSIAREAIRQATLLAPREPPAWLSAAAADAERQIMTVPNRRPGATAVRA